MTTLGHDNPADSRGVTVALAAFHHELATGAGSRLAMLAALRAVASLMGDVGNTRWIRHKVHIGGSGSGLGCDEAAAYREKEAREQANG